ncbi:MULTISPECIES: hypothetical protein [Ramlibacter]|uniref:STAS/SEC14 domain-containing protein n=1 Tax=Ramlibacter aquaticus TaxID=2780094 RepID=A0ABR9S9Y0_9BURK|nr:MULTISPECIES: hypothetical protein [Ramlibacter]MBE7939091.1 hypothetical protein [Ramlibacter aquaticus]
MMFTLSVERGRDRILVVLSGHAALAELLSGIDFLAQLCRRGGIDKAMLDLMAIDHDLSQQELEDIGRYMAQTLAGLAKVGVAVATDQHRGIAAAQARDMGLNLRPFHTIAEAEAWLMSAD